MPTMILASLSSILPEGLLSPSNELEAYTFRIQCEYLRFYEAYQLKKGVKIVCHPKYHEGPSAKAGADTALQRPKASVLLSVHIHPVFIPAASLSILQRMMWSVNG